VHRAPATLACWLWAAVGMFADSLCHVGAPLVQVFPAGAGEYDLPGVPCGAILPHFYHGKI
jgi:hypothetical protein